MTIAAIASLLLGAMFAQNHVDAAEGSLVLPNPVVDSPVAPRSGKETAVIADGCFWGIQAVFQHVKRRQECHFRVLWWFVGHG